MRTTSAFYRILQQSGRAVSAAVVLMDVGPNLGAINRSALLSADYLVVPVAADIFSVQGLQNLGPTIREWRADWSQVTSGVQLPALPLPPGNIDPVGYVVLQNAIRLDRPVQAYAKWLGRIPGAFHVYVEGGSDQDGNAPATDPSCLATVRNYRSLAPLAQDARKAIFDLRAADGAIGSHARLVAMCYDEFRALATRLISICGLGAPTEADAVDVPVPPSAGEH
jgi:cellulose biosynthesis protein BcsQ